MEQGYVQPGGVSALPVRWMRRWPACRRPRVTSIGRRD